MNYTEIATLLSLLALMLIPVYIWGIWLPGRAYTARVAATAHTRHNSGEYVVDMFDRLAREAAQRKAARSARLDSELAAWETAPTAMQPVLAAT